MDARKIVTAPFQFAGCLLYVIILVCVIWPLFFLFYLVAKLANQFAPKFAHRVMMWHDDRMLSPKILPRRWGLPPMTAGSWDEYWKEELTEYSTRPDRDYSPALAMIVRHAWRRILYAGPGLDIEPYALSQAGFEVVVADVSSVAVAELDRRLLDAAWVEKELEGYRKTIAEEGVIELSRPEQGAPTLRNEDFRDHHGKYEVIILDKVLQYYVQDQAMVDEVSAKLMGLLEPDGLLIITFVNDHGARNAYVHALKKLGAHHFRLWDELNDTDPPRPTRRLLAVLTTG